MEKIGQTKAVLGIVREFLLILIFVLLLVSPTWVKNRLQEAGLKKVDLGFAEWEAELRESKENLEEAKQEVTEVRQQLVKVSSALERLYPAPQANQPGIQARELRSLRVQIDSSTVSPDRFDKRLKTSLKAHDQLMEQIQTDKSRK